MLDARRARRDVPAEQPVRPRRGLGPPAARRAGRRSSRSGCASTSIDAYGVARATGMGKRINTIMQTCFFALAGVLPRDEAIAAIKRRDREDLRQARRDGRAEELRRRGRGAGAPARGARCPDAGHEHACAAAGRARRTRPSSSQRVTALMIAGEGDLLPVSALPVDGTYPTGTSQWEKRNIAHEIPVWDAGSVHPVRQVRARLPARRDPRQGRRPGATLRARPDGFKSRAAQVARSSRTRSYTLQVAPEDCTGCALCVEVCPAKDKSEPAPQGDQHAAAAPLREPRARQLGLLPHAAGGRSRAASRPTRSRTSQLLQPLFEFSGACAGCGETPYLKLADAAVRRPRC